MSSTRGILSLREVSKAYGQTVAVDTVSLEIQPGEFLTLLGPSGSGKTTLLMMIAGFISPHTGDILLDGQSILKLPPYKRNIGVVFQHYALFPHLTAYENVAYPLRVRGISAAERNSAVRKVLDLVKLTGLEGRYPKELSGGQQQRVALARALVFRPPILLMDEPLGALDRKLRSEMQLEIKRIQRQLGITTIYVTHDQEEALTISDRIAIMHHGHIAQLGLPVELYERPTSAFVVEFLGESNLLCGEVLNVEDDVIVVKTSGGLVIQVRSREQFKSGDRVIVALRPERAVLGRDEVGANQFRGAVEEVIYLGASLRIFVRLGGELVIVTTNRYAVPTIPRGGSEVVVGWDLDAPILLHR